MGRCPTIFDLCKTALIERIVAGQWLALLANEFGARSRVFGLIGRVGGDKINDKSAKIVVLFGA